MTHQTNQLPDFAVAWKRYEDQGYRYGRDALEQVRFGYRIAQEELQRAAGMRMALVKLSKALGHPPQVLARDGQCAEAALIELAAERLAVATGVKVLSEDRDA